MSEIGLVQIIEGALLAAGKPLTVAQIGQLFEENERPDNATLRSALDEVSARCEERGFELQEVSSGFRYQVRQSLSPWVARLWQERPQRYSRALLETLALIAYRQPITRGEIEEIRGVAVSSNIIKTLHEREWIRVVGHRDVPGRPAMYATTRQFLDYFNLKTLDQLPALADIRDVESLNAELGFSEQGAQVENGSLAVGPGLTVVGGTDHVVQSEEDLSAREQDIEVLAATATDLANTAADMIEEGAGIDPDSESIDAGSSEASDSSSNALDDTDSIAAGPDSRA
ncbi:MAG: SMC-Scp complex subunit ScpB [Pseudomonadota bacterium]